jgi:hypothetical protein
MRISRFAAMAASLATIVVAPLAARAALFSDNFNSAVISTPNYTVVSTDGTSAFPTYAYDYSVMGIPSAPKSGDASTLGVRLDANFSGTPQAEAVTLHTVQSFGGDYTVKFDAWINVNGPFPAGGTGSTNYLGAGVGGDGTTNNFVANTGKGGWTAVNGENGSGIDYRLYKDATLQGVATAQYAAGTASNARNGENGYYDQFGSYNIDNYPVQGAAMGGPAQQTGISDHGSFGMHWHEVTLYVSSTGGTAGAASVTWFADGLKLGTLDAGNGTPFSAIGAVALSYSDPTSNQSDLPTHSFALIDNLSVEAGVPEPTTICLAIPAGMVFIARRWRRPR